MQNNNIATKSQNKVLFDLGQTFITVGAKEALAESNQSPSEFLARHQSGDWGNVCKEDAEENNFQLKMVLESFRFIKLKQMKRFGLLLRQIEVQRRFYCLANISLFKILQTTK